MRARIAGAAAGLMAATVLSACGGSDGGGGNAASTSTGSSSSSSSAESSTSSSGGDAAASTVQVAAKEYSLTLSTTSFSPGEYTFQLVNGGTTTHGLEIDGPGVEDEKADLSAPGASSSVTVTLQAGEYEIYCPVPGHRDMGMQTTITVG
jgi:uncharacterized cupredoxin-like copper-binding protein